MLTLPARTSVTACAPPLYGTLSILMFASRSSIAPAMCAVLPVPAVAYEYAPGCAFASAMNSSIVVALTEGFAISSCGR